MQIAKQALQLRPTGHRCSTCSRLSLTSFSSPTDIKDSTSEPPERESLGVFHEQGVLERELPDIQQGFQDRGDGAGNATEEELSQRKSSAVRAWMESQVGADKIAVAQILKDHSVLVRGGQEQGAKLMEALVAWKRQQ